VQYTNDQQRVLDTYIDFLNNPDEKYMVIQGSSGTWPNRFLWGVILTK